MKNTLIILMAAIPIYLLSSFIFSGTELRGINYTDRAAPDFSYSVGSNFNHRITKEDLHAAKSMYDLLPSHVRWERYPIHKWTIISLSDQSEVYKEGKNFDLNDGQIQFIQGMSYSHDFKILASCQGPFEDINNNEFELACLVSVIPEKEATYPGGSEALINYLRTGSAASITILTAGKLETGKIEFTVSSSGKVKDPKLLSSCGYGLIDERMLELISNMPLSWDPARNADGQSIEQTFVYAYGQIGC